MKDMVGRPIEVGDLVLCSTQGILKFVRITRYNPATRMVSIKPEPKGQERGYAIVYHPKSFLLIRDYDLVTS